MQPQKMMVLDEEEPDPDHGWAPSSRPMDELLDYGLIALDKPRGPTSHEVVAWVRKMLGKEKAGHSGTLDPPVSGVLPVGLGRATKALSLLLLFPKEYWAVMRLHSSVPRKDLDRALSEFTGEIFQRPPQRSSVKREVRSRTIHELELKESQGNLCLLRCLCQSGTYLRKLIYDVGEVLGVGATMVELRRTRVGPLSVTDGLVTLHQLGDALFRLKNGDESAIRAAVYPVERCIGSLGRIVARGSAVDAVCHGARLALPGVLSASEGVTKGETVAILSPKGELVAIGRSLISAADLKTMTRGLASTVERVVMKPGTYPMMWKHKRAPERPAAKG